MNPQAAVALQFFNSAGTIAGIAEGAKIVAYTLLLSLGARLRYFTAKLG